MNFSDPYQAYIEGSVFSGNPLRMVIALYEGTIESIRQARECLHSGDVWGRSKAINRCVKLLTELLVSLDHQEGGEISANLKRLYSYIQCRLLEAHAKKTEEPLNEAERLLGTILEGWHAAAEKLTLESHQSKSIPPGSYAVEESSEKNPAWGYGIFETAELAGCVSATF